MIIKTIEEANEKGSWTKTRPAIKEQTAAGVELAVAHSFFFCWGSFRCFDSPL